MRKRYLSVSLVLALALSVVAQSLQGAKSFATTQPSFINGKMAYIDMQPGSNILWMRNGDGSNPVQVHTSSNLLSAPTWSPNGKKLAFNEGTPAEIYVMNADGTGLTNLTNNAGRDEVASWAPSGGKIAFVSDRGRAVADYRLHMMNEDGTSQVDVSDPATELDRFPHWSPDGKKIYYNSIRGGSEQIYVYDTVADTHTQFTNLPGSAVGPSVAPDGSKVVFAYPGPGDTKLQLYVQNADGTGLQKLFELCSDQYSQYPSWSPDGRKILFISECNTAPKSKLYMIDSDGTDPKLLSATSEDVWTKPGWQSVPVGSITQDPDTGVIVVEQDGDHEDVDYEVHKDHEVFIAGKSGNVIVHAEGVLKGTGATGKITVENSGRVAPGRSPGCLTSGDLVMNSGSTLDEELGGTTVCTGYDSVDVTGTVTLTNPTLNVTHYGGFAPATGNTFTIISNDGADAVTGTFNGLAQGASFAVAGATYVISYTGGDGNDVVLTVTQGAPQAPNTGFGLLLTGPGRTVGIITLCAVSLLLISRKFKHGSFR